jgi:hypothetical protein
MAIQENISDDTMAVVTVDAAPMVVAMTVADGTGEAIENATSCVLSEARNANNSPKKVVDRELRQPFPVKVYEMLENAEKKQFSHIVSWNSAGTGFMVHDKDHFTKEIVPHYFNLTKYKSFQRQVRNNPIDANFFSTHVFGCSPQYDQHHLYYFPACMYFSVVPLWLPTSDCRAEQGIAVP